MLGIRRLLAVAGGMILCSAAVMTANAECYDISAGNIAVTASPQGQIITYLGNEYEDAAPVITGTTRENTVVLTAQADQRLYVTFESLSIDLSAGENGAPVVICGEGSTVVKLSGASELKASAMNAAMDVRAPVYLCNAGEEPGELTAQGGAFGAGIGGGAGQSACGISILGGRIHAVGGAMAAGIGGGQYGDAERIAVLGGEVDAIGGGKAAGIGAGWCGSSSYITLMGGKVAASGETAVGSTKDALCVDIAASDAQRQLKLDDEDTALIPAGDSVRIPAECKTLQMEEDTKDLPAEEAVDDAEEIAEATEEATEATTELTAEESEKAEETNEAAADEAENTEETTEAGVEEPEKAEGTTEAVAEEAEKTEENTEAVAEEAEKTEETTETAEEESEKAVENAEVIAEKEEKAEETTEAATEQAEETAAEAEPASSEKNQLTFEDEKKTPETAATEAVSEDNGETQKETKTADEAAEKSAEEAASEEEKKPDETTAGTQTEEKTDAPEAIFTTETLCVQDAQGNCQEFTITRKNNMLEIHADSKDVVLKFSADDVKLWQDNGIYLIRLSFGGRNARTTVHGIQKLLDEKTQETFLKIHIKGGMTLIKDGTSYALP